MHLVSTRDPSLTGLPSPRISSWTVHCDPAAVGSVAGCYDQGIPAVGNVDFKFGSPQVC